MASGKTRTSWLFKICITRHNPCCLGDHSCSTLTGLVSQITLDAALKAKALCTRILLTQNLLCSTLERNHKLYPLYRTCISEGFLEVVLKSLRIPGLASQVHTIGQVNLKYHLPIIHTSHTVHLLPKIEKKVTIYFDS